MNLSDRLLARSERSGECLLWMGTVNWGGYGKIKVGSASVGVHRAAFQEWVGPIPPGLELDHLCSVRNCIEPTHLEPVTRGENVRRSRSFGGVNARKATCPRGHVLPPHEPGGKRDCVPCRKRRTECDACGLELSRKSLVRHRALLHPAPELDQVSA